MSSKKGGLGRNLDSLIPTPINRAGSNETVGERSESWSLRLSYCYPTPERITQGVMALSKVVEQEMLNRGITN
ncbi:MAG: hypothetical protein EBV67_04315 [Actinobacteria bacterium]|nr:hypothetical protein [Actinomycetota bacterium]